MDLRIGLEFEFEFEFGCVDPYFFDRGRHEEEKLRKVGRLKK